MLRAFDIVVSAPLLTAFADVVVLDYDGRRRRRGLLTARGGLTFLVDLPQAPALNAGDAFVLEDGRKILIEAAPEKLMEITCANALHLARIAWHIGNRHLDAQISEGAIRIRADHVIVAMVEGLGASVKPIEAPFTPERGAYGVGSGHGHGHGAKHEH